MYFAFFYCGLGDVAFYDDGELLEYVQVRTIKVEHGKILYFVEYMPGFET